MPLPYIPETITVHLGAPDAPAQNVTVSFPDYIKNVASSEIYPTWPENAIRANIYAQVSYALNRIYTEYYRSRGYDFDITNSTAIDQSYVQGRDIFENISEIVDELFNDYLTRPGSVEPLFAAYCDGVRVQCDGLSQWGTVELAEAGRTPYEILTNYYGDNLNINTDTPILPFTGSLPYRALRLGNFGDDVRAVQIRLNRISANYPSIPKILPVDGVFGLSTENAVREFQRIFDLTQDGIVGPATWYKILRIYNGVKRLSELSSEGLALSEVSAQFPTELSRGDSGIFVREFQYFLSVLGENLAAIPEIAIDGDFGAATERAVRAFQQAYGLPVTGIVDEETWAELYNVYRGIVLSTPDYYTGVPTAPFPGFLLLIGTQGNEVRLLQEYLNALSEVYGELPPVTADGVFGMATRNAVLTFQRLAGLNPSGIVDALTWDAIADAYSDIRYGLYTSEGQFGGTTLGQ
ncbi:MAG: spore cortex-lytic protein [Ruminococcaceae bacterium]|nr:spore cortex-lytic protein [Oscillospiraceae bacterium]